MSTMVSSAAAIRGSSGFEQASLRPRRRAAATDHAAPSCARANGGAITLFEVRFASAMSDSDLAFLARSLDLVTHMHPKLRDTPTSPGVLRVDFESGLFLKRGSPDGQWLLEGRSWGHPPSWVAHEWHLRAAAAAQHLDPSVTLPARLDPSGSSAHDPAQVTHSRAGLADKRLAAA
jgi:hypothetical protein